MDNEVDWARQFNWDRTTSNAEHWAAYQKEHSLGNRKDDIRRVEEIRQMYDIPTDEWYGDDWYTVRRMADASVGIKWDTDDLADWQKGDEMSVLKKTRDRLAEHKALVTAEISARSGPMTDFDATALEAAGGF